MSSPTPTSPATANSSAPITEPLPQLSAEAREVIGRAVDQAEAVVLGAGAGLSTAAGLTYDGPRFQRLFADLIALHDLTDLYSASFRQYDTPEQQWAFWSRAIMANRYDLPPLPVMQGLRELIEGTEHFVITTNVDHTFQLNGFDKQRFFYTQGDYGLFQCSVPCRQETWDNEEQVRAMASQQRDGSIPSELVPTCPRCGTEAKMNLRDDASFVQDQGWYAAAERYQHFLDEHRSGRVLHLEVGIGWNTPAIIKYPFWQRVHTNPDAHYLLVNPDTRVPAEIAERTTVLASLT